jgi:hypothetical protein
MINTGKLLASPDSVSRKSAFFTSERVCVLRVSQTKIQKQNTSKINPLVLEMETPYFVYIRQEINYVIF